MRNRLKHPYTAIFICLLTLIISLTSPSTQALPSYARQTGVSCNVCHTQAFGPNLTPFGRDFKLGGYTMSGGTSKLPAFSALVSGSFTNTAKNQDVSNLPTGSHANNNFTFDNASLFYGGRIYDKIGAFAELAYDGVGKRLGLDNTDIRFADSVDFGDTSINYGVSLNNNPTVQDLWNTTAWGFPYNGSAVQPAPGASALIDGGLGVQVGGATAYAMINNLLYVEAGAYSSFSSNLQRGIGIAAPDRIRLNSPAPYWRVALQHDWKGHYFSVGHYGMMADVLPGRNSSLTGADHYTDVAFDATYQYMGNPKHIFEGKTTYIYEDQQLLATNGVPGKTYLKVYKLNLAYTFDQTYGLTLAYNHVSGSHDADLNRPNTDYMTVEAIYVPFGKVSSLLNPWLNLRASLQYIGYTQANGNYKYAGDNNTLMLNGMLIF